MKNYDDQIAMCVESNSDLRIVNEDTKIALENEIIFIKTLVQECKDSFDLKLDKTELKRQQTGFDLKDDFLLASFLSTYSFKGLPQ